MKRLVPAMTFVLMAIAACSPRGDNNSVERHADSASAIQIAEASDQPAAARSSEEQAGMYRWSGGMQMGVFWAAVKNKDGDVLRFEDESAEDDSPAWSVPSVEIADTTQAEKIGKGDLINFVLDGRSWTFGFASDGAIFTPTPMSGSGHSDAAELIEEMKTSNASTLCVEFSRADYRTCFSLAGAADALGSGELVR